MTQQIVLRNTANAIEHGSLWGADRKHHPEVTLLRAGTLEGQKNGGDLQVARMIQSGILPLEAG